MQKKWVCEHNFKTKSKQKKNLDTFILCSFIFKIFYFVL